MEHDNIMLSKTPSTLRLNIEVVFVVLCAYLGKAFAHRTHLEWRHGLGGERPVSPCAAIAIATTDRAGAAKFITTYIATLIIILLGT